MNPKSEIRSPKEGRNPKPEGPVVRPKFRISEFGFRPSDFFS